MKYGHRGNAKNTTLAGGINATDLTITGVDLTGWPDGTTGVFWAAVDRGLLTEEKIMCSGRTGNVLQVWTDVGDSGRGKDDTVAQSHSVNATLEHIWTATEAEVASSHINDATTDVHPQYILEADADTLFVPLSVVDAKGDLLAATEADTVDRVAVGSDGTVLTADSTLPTGLKWAVPANTGATGGGTDRVFYENDDTVTEDYTITASRNAVTAGPVTISSGVTVTVPSGSSWVVV